MALHRSTAALQEQILTTLTEWLADPATSGNPSTLVTAGIIYVNEEDYVAALKACHLGLSLEM